MERSLRHVVSLEDQGFGNKEQRERLVVALLNVEQIKMVSVITQVQLGRSKMQRKINYSDLKLLINNVNDPDLLNILQGIEKRGPHLDKGKYATGRYLIDISDEDTESILEVLSDILVGSGCDKNGELKPLGNQVEILIDVFSDA